MSIKTLSDPPQSIDTLLNSAHAIAGLSLGELANAISQFAPDHLLYAKGWSGQLIEYYLGASAGNTSEPDFKNLSIELKTIPVDNNGTPTETTFVCALPLLDIIHETWHQSSVYQKLKHVLWIPIQSNKQTPISERIIGMPYLWQMDQQSEIALRADWEEFAEMIGLGQIEQITARQGNCLQVRPKAADSKVRTKARNEQGQIISTLPRGFYLRTSFTKKLLSEFYA